MRFFKEHILRKQHTEFEFVLQGGASSSPHCYCYSVDSMSHSNYIIHIVLVHRLFFKQRSQAPTVDMINKSYLFLFLYSTHLAVSRVVESWQLSEFGSMVWWLKVQITQMLVGTTHDATREPSQFCNVHQILLVLGLKALSFHHLAVQQMNVKEKLSLYKV